MISLLDWREGEGWIMGVTPRNDTSESPNRVCYSVVVKAVEETDLVRVQLVEEGATVMSPKGIVLEVLHVGP